MRSPLATQDVPIDQAAEDHCDKRHESTSSRARTRAERHADQRQERASNQRDDQPSGHKGAYSDPDAAGDVEHEHLANPQYA